METAKILANRLDVKKNKVVATENLQPSGYSDQLINEINQKYGEFENIAIIGHEPYLSNLVSLLICGEASASLKLKKGSVTELSVDVLEHGKCASLNWLMPPAYLTHIGENS